MRTYLLDSDVLIDLFNRKSKTVELISELVAERAGIAISVVSITEVRAGWDDDQASQYLPKLYDLVNITPVTAEIAEKAGGYRKMYSKKGKVIHTIDAIIATTAIINNYWLITRNLKDYPMPEIKIYDEQETAK